MDIANPVLRESPMKIDDTSTLIVSIEDPGEECDDEANKAMTNAMAKGSVKVLYLAVNGDKSSKERLEICDEMGVSPPKDSTHARQLGIERWKRSCLSEITSLGKNLKRKACVIVQHNAPAYGQDLEHIEAISQVLEDSQDQGIFDYVYVTQGSFGQCMNTKDGAGLAAGRRLKRKAKKTFCTDSGANMKFSHNSSKAVSEAVLRVSGLVFVKNTLGRAPAHGFCRHLIAPRGANYESAESLYNTIKKEDHPEWDAIEATEAAMEAAKAYCDQKNPDNFPKAQAFSVDRAAKLGQTPQDQINGLAKILQSFKILFGIDEGTILYSSDPRWVDADKKGDFHEIYKNVMKAMEVNPDAEWTPAYDPTCAAAVFTYMCGASNPPKKRKMSDWFDQGEPTEDGIIPLTWKGKATLGDVAIAMADYDF